MRVINPALILDVFIDNPATRKRKLLGGMQIRPFDVMKCEFRFDHPESRRMNVYV
jgi:hypothetical protein